MSYYSNNGFNAIAPVTRNLLIINFIIWVACSFMPRIIEFLGLRYFQVQGFYIYQLVTYMFTHEAFSHLFFNMFALFMFGSVIERTWGPKRYLIYYLTTGIGAGIIQLLVWYIQIRNGNIPYQYADFLVTIGASGAVFGLLLAFGMLFPNAPLYLMFVPIPVKAKYFVLGYGLIELIFGMSNRAGDNVAHFAHLGGMLFGIILILYWRKNEYGYYRRNPLWEKLISFFKRKPRRMKIQYRRPETDQEYNARKHTESLEIDRILEKINYSGYNSLTDDEKKKLFDAGRK